MTIGILLDNYSDALNLSPRFSFSLLGSSSSVTLAGGTATSIPGATRVSGCPISGCPPTNNGGVLRWSYPSGGSWIVKSISIGDDASKVFSGSVGYTHSSWLFSSQDSGIAIPLWTHQNSVLGLSKKVDSAENAGLHVDFRKKNIIPGDQNSGWKSAIRAFDSSSSVVLWEREFPGLTDQNSPGGIAISDDGSRIIALSMDNSVSGVYLMSLDSSGNVLYSGSPDSFVGLPSGIGIGYALSGDGSTLMIMSNLKVIFVDVDTGSTIASSFNFGFPPTGAVAISNDGTRGVALATTGGAGFASSILRVYELQGSLVTTDITLPGNPSFISSTGIDLSDDGSKVTYGYLGLGVANAGSGGIALWDITIPASPVLLNDYFFDDGSGSYATQILISMTPDGSRYAAGMWGDEFGVIPEVMVFDQISSSPIAEFSTTDSVLAIEISPQGDQVAVATRLGHATTAGGDGELAVYDIL